MSNYSPCDVIIPVYNALDELKECVTSLLKYTHNCHRIIIINDCSPDREVRTYLNELESIDNILVIENENNLGFVGTVNKGMSHSDRDVILLNSDTIVTQDWIEKLIDVAYMETNIATVTPLTNNGTICSVPNFNEDNSIPNGFTIDSFANFIEKISLRKFPEIPTAVGFCMFIKRTVINEIGLFDIEAFGKGYGEENDFCCRAIEHGYINVLADNVYIYHKGSMSFQGKKAELIRQNLKVLNKRYPYFEKKIHDFIFRRNPLIDIHENINMRIPYYANSHEMNGNILFVIHNLFDEAYNHPVGGTEYHVKDIVENLQDYNCYILVTNGIEMVLEHYSKGAFVGKYRFSLSNEITLFHFHHAQYANIFEKIISTFDIGLVHIHHLRMHSFDSVHIAKRLGIKVIMTLHDFYLFCPKVNLLDDNNNYCIDIRSESKCSSCLNASFGFHTTFINTWKRNVIELINQVDLFIAPSHSTKKIFTDEFGALISEKIRTIAHGIEIPRRMTSSKAPKGKRLRAGFLGGLAPAKGSDTIYEVVTNYPKEEIEWHLIGGLGDQKLNLLNQKNLIKHGTYDREKINEILEQLQLDIICLFSPWPETFSYTLSEAWNNHIPVVVTPMGALKERVESVSGGWVTEDNSLKAIMNKLESIQKLDQSEWDKVIDNIVTYKFISKSGMVKDYKELYENYYQTLPRGYTNMFDGKVVLEALRYYMPALHISATDYDNQINEMKRELYLIKTTIGWKVLDRLRRNDSWFLKFGKKLIHLLLRYKRR